MTEQWYCDRCRQRHICTYLKLNKVTRQNEFCPPLAEISDGNVPCKEVLASEVCGEGYEAFANRDYKDVLNEVQDNKTTEHTRRHDEIMAMPDEQFTDLLKKAVAALAFFEISARKSMRVLKLAERTFYRYFRGK